MNDPHVPDLDSLVALHDDARLVLLKNLQDRQRARPTPFDLVQILRRWDHEDTHSRILGWLLDSSESHGLGVEFLHQFITHAGQGGDLSHTAVWPDSTTEVEKHIAGRRLDLLIRSDAGKVLLVIENKWGSTEHSGQLRDYRTHIEQSWEFRDYARHFVYLTLRGGRPIEPHEALGLRSATT